MTTNVIGLSTEIELKIRIRKLTWIDAHISVEGDVFRLLRMCVRLC